MQLAVLLVVVSGYNDFGGFGYSVCICANASRLVDWFVLKREEKWPVFIHSQKHQSA